MAARLGSRFVIATLVALIATALCAPVAGAGSILGLNNNCGATSQPFAQFGDYRLYTFGTNGGLESGLNGWSSSGARVVADNESFFVHSDADDYSLEIPAGGVAMSPKLCMGTTSTVLRFFARSSGSSGSVRVQVVLRNLLGSVVGILDVSRVDADGSWDAAPPILNLDSLLGILGVSSIQLKFTGLSGTVRIDDLYVDPWESRGA